MSRAALAVAVCKAGNLLATLRTPRVFPMRAFSGILCTAPSGALGVIGRDRAAALLVRDLVDQYRSLLLFPCSIFEPNKLAIYFGGRNSPFSQPTAFGFTGSDTITLCSLRPHLPHSNVRCSNPSGPPSTQAIDIRVWHLEQTERPISERTDDFRMDSNAD